jgi:hypothetical protein
VIVSCEKYCVARTPVKVLLWMQHCGCPQGKALEGPTYSALLQLWNMFQQRELPGVRNEDPDPTGALDWPITRQRFNTGTQLPCNAEQQDDMMWQAYA